MKLALISCNLAIYFNLIVAYLKYINDDDDDDDERTHGNKGREGISLPVYNTIFCGSQHGFLYTDLPPS